MQSITILSSYNNQSVIASIVKESDNLLFSSWHYWWKFITNVSIIVIKSYIPFRLWHVLDEWVTLFMTTKKCTGCFI